MNGHGRTYEKKIHQQNEEGKQHIRYTYLLGLREGWPLGCLLGCLDGSEDGLITGCLDG